MGYETLITASYILFAAGGILAAVFIFAAKKAGALSGALKKGYLDGTDEGDSVYMPESGKGGIKSAAEKKQEEVSAWMAQVSQKGGAGNKHAPKCEMEAEPSASSGKAGGAGQEGSSPAAGEPGVLPQAKAPESAHTGILMQEGDSPSGKKAATQTGVLPADAAQAHTGVLGGTGEEPKGNAGGASPHTGVLNEAKQAAPQHTGVLPAKSHESAPHTGVLNAESQPPAQHTGVLSANGQHGSQHTGVLPAKSQPQKKDGEGSGAPHKGPGKKPAGKNDGREKPPSAAHTGVLSAGRPDTGVLVRQGGAEPQGGSQPPAHTGVLSANGGRHGGNKNGGAHEKESPPAKSHGEQQEEGQDGLLNMLFPGIEQ
jgi:hypothetical protein